MADNQDIILSAEDDQNGFLSFRFNNEDFGEFIKALLGKPQTITKRIVGNFEIHLSHLQNFHLLLQQRVQQNQARLIQLTTQIFYDDDSSILLSSYDELVSYNEIKPVVSTAVKLTWTYLIKFPDKNVPEKQEVELQILTNPKKNVVEDSESPVKLPNSGEFRIFIRHTSRTWGSDIESLLTHQINSLIKIENSVVGLINKYYFVVGLIVAIVIILTAAFALDILDDRYSTLVAKKAQEFLLLSKSDFNRKIDYLISYETSGRYKSGYTGWFLGGGFILGIGLGILAGWLSLIKQHSYLILTREAQKQSEDLKRNRKLQIIVLVLSLIGSLLIGLFTNWLSTKLHIG